MIPQKLFYPKYLSMNREAIFKEDLDSFYNTISKALQLDDEENFEEKTASFTYEKFKQFYKEHSLFALHFSMTKEEKRKDYYDTLFGVIISYLFKDVKQSHFTFAKLYSLYLLYSIYYTQINDIYYQVNISTEFFEKVNELILTLRRSNNEKLRLIAFQLFQLIKKMKDEDAFQIGVVPGFKNITLNQYGLPLHTKMIYYDYNDVMSFPFSEFKEDEEEANELDKLNSKYQYDMNKIQKEIKKWKKE